MSLAAFITQVVGLTITGVTTTYDIDAIPESLPTSALPAMLPSIPYRAGGGEQALLVLQSDSNLAHDATYRVDWIIYMEPKGQKPPKTYVKSQVDMLDAFLTAVRTNDKDFAGDLDVFSPRAGIVPYGDEEYQAVIIGTQFKEAI